MKPRYPDVRVSLTSRHPLALVSAVRLALRHAGADADEIARFSTEALSSGGPARVRELAGRWVSIEGHDELA